MQELRLRQQLTLAPRLQQSVKMLQMSSLEFSMAIQQALATNPFLEEDAPDDGGEPRQREPDSPPAAGSPERTTDPPREAEAAAPSQHEYSGDYPARPRSDESPDLAQWNAALPSMRERLSRSLDGYRLSARDRALTELIVDALDEDGYLHVPLSELCRESQEFDPPPAEEEWNAALRLVQQVDAPGLAARDLSECLMLQLDCVRHAAPRVHGLAMEIARAHLPQLARRDNTGLMRCLQCTDAELRGACDLIRSLDPKPGLRYSNEAPAYVVPDVYVQKWQSRWQVIVNRRATPRARLHEAYADLFHRAHMDDRSPMAQELQEARWLVRNVEQRHTTIQRVAQAIVKKQQMFFDYGETALRPLMLREVAQELEMHESTVSRATANKYMVTPRGVFEFRHFFSRELATRSGGSCSSAAVRALIKEMIENEDAAGPLSDVALTQQLASQGILLARRTVSKYRAQLRLPQAELRRQY